MSATRSTPPHRYTTPMTNWPNVVLMLDQRLRRWPTLNQHFMSVSCWLGKLSLSIYRGQLFSDPRGNTIVCVSTQSPHKRIGELFPHRCRSSI